MALGIKSISDIEVGDILYATKQCQAYIAPDISSKSYVYLDEIIGEVLDTNVEGINSKFVPKDYTNYIKVQVGAETLYVVYDVMVLEFRANSGNNYPAKKTSSVAQFDIKKGVDTLLKLLGVNNKQIDTTGGSNVIDTDTGVINDNGDTQDTPWYQKYLLYIIGFVIFAVALYFLLRPKITHGINVVQALPSLQGTKIPKPLKMT